MHGRFHELEKIRLELFHANKKRVFDLATRIIFILDFAMEDEDQVHPHNLLDKVEGIMEGFTWWGRFYSIKY